jgi:hypothetical protein
VWAAPIRTVVARLQAEDFVRRDVDPILFMISLFSITLYYHASINRYQHVMPEMDLVSPQAMADARRQIVELLVHGLMTFPSKEDKP